MIKINVFQNKEIKRLNQLGFELIETEVRELL